MSRTLLKIELEREEDGRWIRETPDLPGVLTYGKTRFSLIILLIPWR